MTKEKYKTTYKKKFSSFKECDQCKFRIHNKIELKRSRVGANHFHLIRNATSTLKDIILSSITQVIYFFFYFLIPVFYLLKHTSPAMRFNFNKLDDARIFSFISKFSL